MTTATVPQFRELDAEGNLVRLHLHDGQTAAWVSQARIVAMLGGTQLGKTCFGPHWLLREIERCGPGDYLAITATFPLLKLKMLPEFLYVFDTLYHLGTWREGDRVYTFRDGKTRVIFGSATNPESIESATAKAAWLDEAGQEQFKRDAWDAIMRRLSLSQGRVLITTTLYGLTWLRSEIFSKCDHKREGPVTWLWHEDGEGKRDIEIIQIDSIVNPAFPREEWERARRTLPEWKFNLFYRGRFDRPAGLIYDCLDEATCVIPRFQLPDAWPRYVGHDFGPLNTAAVWAAQDAGTGYFYIYRTYLAGGKSAYQHAAEFKRLSEGERVLRRVGGAHAEGGWRESFTAAGWPILEPEQQRAKDVLLGIQAVYGLFKTNMVYIFDDLHDLLDELRSYSWELDERYEAVEGKIADKSRYHLLDGVRYMVSDFAPERVVSRPSKPSVIRGLYR